MSKDATEKLLYVGYGANRDPSMVEAIIGDVPHVLGSVAIQDVELCVQLSDQVSDKVLDSAPTPVSPKQIISGAWGGNSMFGTYAIRPKEGSSVDATLFELTPLQRALIADWELIEFGWYDRMAVTVKLKDGKWLKAQTEGFTTGQEVNEVVDGNNYETFLLNPADMFKAAEKARLEYLERLEQTKN